MATSLYVGHTLVANISEQHLLTHLLRYCILYAFSHKCKNSEGRSCGAGTEVTWSRRGFNLCVALSYRNRGVLLFREARVKGCPEWGAEWMGKLRIQMERVTEIWLGGILVDYKLKFNYLSVLTYIQKRNRDEWRSNKQISLIIVIFDRGLCPADKWAEMEN